MNLKYKKATIDDIEILMKTRIEVLRAANKLSDDVDMKEVEKISYKYYKNALQNETHTACRSVRAVCSTDDHASWFGIRNSSRNSSDKVGFENQFYFRGV